MDVATLRRPVEMPPASSPRAPGSTLETVGRPAETGVNFVCSGALTHSAPSLDVAPCPY